MAQTGFTPIITYHSTTATQVPDAANLSPGEMALNIADMKLYAENSSGTVTLLASASGASGDVVGPASATDNAITRFDGTTGKLVQNSGVTIDDSNNVSGVAQLNATTADLTNIEVTNLKAKDGTAAASIADSTGVVTITSLSSTTGNITTVNSTTVDTTNLEVTNIKAKDGTAAASIADSTGKITVSTELAVDNLNLSGNTLSSTNSNGAINLTPNGTGQVTVTNDALVSGLTVGKGAGAVSTNTAVGASALAANTTGADNTAFGLDALTANTTGDVNAAFGSRALLANTTGTWNVAVGKDAMLANTTGGNNVAIGRALASNTTASDNTALGYVALYYNTTGANNTAVGSGALFVNTTASNNTAVGYQAGYNNTTGSENVMIGSTAGYSNTAGTRIVAIGHEALYSNTAGSNVAIGWQAGRNNTTGGVTALGYYCLRSNTTGTANVAMGDQALAANTTGGSNVAIGNFSGISSTVASNNTFLGYAAGYGASGSNNTFVGWLTGYNSTGSENTFVGNVAGNAMTTGIKNTIIGRYNGNQGGLDIRTASNYIVLSDGDGNPRLIGDGSGNWVAGGTSTSTRLSAIGTPTIGALSASIPNDPNGSSAATLTIGANTNGGVWAGGGYGLRIIDKTSNSGSGQTGYGLYVSAPYDGVNASGSTYALIKYGIYVDDIYSFYGINAVPNTTNWGLFVKGGAYNHMANPLLLGTTTPVSGGGKLQVSDGITFPATQNASSNANTLDDYERGTFSANATAITNCSSISVTSAVYVKIGRQVTCEITGTFTVTASATNTYFIFDVPFSAQLSAGGAPGQGTYGNSTNNNGLVIDNSGGTDYQYGFWVQGVNNTESGASKAFQLGLTYIASA